MDGQGWVVHRYCYRKLGVALSGLSLHRGAQGMDKWTLQGLGGGALALERGWYAARFGKMGPLAWWEEGKGPSCRVLSPGSGLKPPAEQLSTPTPETSALGRLLSHGPLLAGPGSRAGLTLGNPRAAE